jgi:hypothetical protein
MRELRIFLERKARHPTFVIIPVFYELTVEQCSNLERLYGSEPWPSSPGVPNDTDVLKGWAEDVKKLLASTGSKIEEVRWGVLHRSAASEREMSRSGGVASVLYPPAHARNCCTLSYVATTYGLDSVSTYRCWTPPLGVPSTCAGLGTDWGPSTVPG